MIILFTAGPAFGLPEASPYVTKTEVQLQMAGIAYRKERATPDLSPKGQLPFIDDEGERIGDSTFIRAHIERKYGVDLDAGLDARERAQAWALERMIENHLTWAVIYFRWLVPENFEKGPSHWFDGVPEPARAGVKADVLGRVTAAMRAVGIARHSPEEIVGLGDRSLSALSLQLGDRPYLMGERPAGVDAMAFGSLACLLTPFFASPLRQRAIAYDNLTAYADRMMRAHFPDHPWSI
jgi:glutathione S-transferase